jgi:hypothetical protein
MKTVHSLATLSSAVLGAALVCLSAARPAAADSGFRCPSTGRLVSTGDHMIEVRKKCGDPDFVTQRTEKRKVKVTVRHRINRHEEEDVTEEREIEVLVDEWTYDLGAERFIRLVAFENAHVVGIGTGGYGTRPVQ